MYWLSEQADTVILVYGKGGNVFLNPYCLLSSGYESPLREFRWSSVFVGILKMVLSIEHSVR